jgi:integrase
MKVTVSVQKRGATSWRIRTRWKEDGDWQEISETLRGTQREAEAHKELILSEFAAGRRSKLSFDTVPVYLKRWVEYRLAVGAIKASSASYYRTALRPVAEYFSDTRLAALTPDRCRAFVYDDVMRSGVKLARHRFVIAKAALENAVREGLVPTNPYKQIEAPRVPKERQKPTLTEQQMRSLWDESYAHEAVGLCIRLALSTGLRRGELAALQWAHIKGDVLTVQQNVTRVDGKLIVSTPKTVSSIRDVKLPQQMVLELERLRGREEDYLFSADGPHCPMNLAQKVQRVMNAIGLSDMSMHDLRHAHATQLLRKGIPVKAVSVRLGHAKIATTLDVYAHAMPQDADDIVLAIGNVLGPNGPALS